MSEITDEHYELLESYMDGPKIWDAASVLAKVHDLLRAGLVEPADGEGRSLRFEITAAGITALAGREGAETCTRCKGLVMRDHENDWVHVVPGGLTGACPDLVAQPPVAAPLDGVLLTRAEAKEVAELLDEARRDWDALAGSAEPREESSPYVARLWGLVNAAARYVERLEEQTGG